MKKSNPIYESGKSPANRVLVLLLTTCLLFTLSLPAASASTTPQSTASAADSLTQAAAACSPGSLVSVYVAGGDMLYDTLYGARTEDHPRLNKICGIIKKFMDAGISVAPFDPTPETFFHGLEMTFAGNIYASIFQSLDSIYLESAGVVLKLTDSKAIETFQSFLQGTEYLTLTPAKLQYGGQVHLKGHQPNFPSSSGVYVFWIPERETYTSSSPSNKATTAPYPYDSALLLYEGKQQFGYYDLTFLLPVMAKAADGSMKRLGSKGRLYVAVWQGQGGKYSYDMLELLPASKPFLSVNGVPTESEDLRPLLRDGRAYIPLRSVAKLAGQSITWDASTWSVLIRSNPPQESKATYSFPQLWIDNKLASPELQPILLGGLTYVPIRALTAAFGISVVWDRESRGVLIDF